jgi:molybdopterin synthase catalytic subunit
LQQRIFRLGEAEARSVIGMRFSYDAEKVAAAVRETEALEGIFHVRVWLGEGELKLGDDIMLVLIGGDIRPHVVDALQFLVGRIKSECVREEEIFA